MAIICEVTAVVFICGEVITGCKITGKDDGGSIICQVPLANIMVDVSPGTESLNVGQIVSVVVRAARYQIDSQTVSIVATLHGPNIYAPVYKLAPFGSADVAILSDVRARVEFEETARDELQKTQSKAWTFFAQLLYGYKTRREAPTDVTVMSLGELVLMGDGGRGSISHREHPDNSLPPGDGSTGSIRSPRTPGDGVMYVSRDPRMDLTTSSVYVHNAAVNAPASQSKSVSTSITVDTLLPSNVLVTLYEDYCSQLRVIREMIDVYSTVDLVRSHQNLWKTYAASRR
jgi:hypothetical protein